MPTVGKRPEQGTKGLTYTHHKCPPKTKKQGYLAGPIHGLECHVKGLTKPCEKDLLGEKAPCPGCQALEPKDWRGYVPLRDHTGRPCCIIITRAVLDVADRIKPKSRVIWGRDDSEFDPVYMIEGMAGREWHHWWPDREANDNMSYWLSVVWKRPHLLPALQLRFTPRGEETPIPAPSSLDGAPAWLGGVADSLISKELGVTPEVAKKMREQRNEQFAKKNGKH